LTAEDPDERMPAEGDPLSEPDIVAIRDWIAAGAVFDGPDPEAPLTSLIPLAPHQAPPESYPAPLPVAALEFSPDGSQLFTGGYHEILVWDTATGTLRRRLPGLPSRILDLSVQPGGERIAAAGGDPGRHGEVRILRLDSGETEKVLSRSSDVLLAARFSPDGSALATGGANNLLEFYSASDWSLRHRWAHHADWVTAIAWNFDGSLLASGSRDRSIKVYNAGDGSRTSNLTGHQKSVVALAFAPDAKRVVSVSLDKTFRQWNLDDDSAVGKPASIDRAPAKLVTSAPAFLIALADGNIALRDPVTGDASGSWSAHTDSIVSIAVHEPSATVAAGSMDGQVALIDLTNGSVRLRFLAAP
jgi:WD40 repeat protein